jgi:hypothetical protein
MIPSAPPRQERVVSYSRRWIPNLTRLALGLAGATLVACGGGGQDARATYANDADTGSAAPATQQTLSPNPAMGTNTQGLQDRTGRPGVAGDSGQPAVAPMDARKGQNPPPVPQPGQPGATKRP